MTDSELKTLHSLSATNPSSSSTKPDHNGPSSLSTICYSLGPRHRLVAPFLPSTAGPLAATFCPEVVMASSSRRSLKYLSLYAALVRESPCRGDPFYEGIAEKIVAAQICASISCPLDFFVLTSWACKLRAPSDEVVLPHSLPFPCLKKGRRNSWRSLRGDSAEICQPL